MGPLLAGRADWEVNNDALGGDPVVGIEKVLKLYMIRKFGIIDNICDAIQTFRSMRDIRIMRISRENPSGGVVSKFYEFKERDCVPGNLNGKLLKAEYGAASNFAQVTSLVSTLLDGRADWEVNNDVLGGDPVSGIEKVLKVYMIQEPVVAPPSKALRGLRNYATR